MLFCWGSKQTELTLSVPTLLDSSCVPGGGGIGPPLNYCHRMTILLFFLSQSSCLGCKGLETKRTALYVENSSPEIFSKNHCFWQKSNFFEHCYLETKHFIEKRSAKIKPRNLECSSFLHKDHNGHT